MKRNKKKGFTLVELIAVIAILAILAAIIVPKIGSYTASANKSKWIADAKTIAQAVELYNAETGTNNIAASDTLAKVKDIIYAGGTTANGSGVNSSGSAVSASITDGTGKKYIGTWPAALKVRTASGVTDAVMSGTGLSTYQQLLDYISNP